MSSSLPPKGESQVRTYPPVRKFMLQPARALVTEPGIGEPRATLRTGGSPNSFVAMDAKVMLCDFAEVSGGKLFVSGAGLALLASATPETPFRVNVTLAILGLINQEDTDVQHKMTIELVKVEPHQRNPGDAGG